MSGRTLAACNTRDDGQADGHQGIGVGSGTGASTAGNASSKCTLSMKKSYDEVPVDMMEMTFPVAAKPTRAFPLFRLGTKVERRRVAGIVRNDVVLVFRLTVEKVEEHVVDVVVERDGHRIEQALAEARRAVHARFVSREIGGCGQNDAALEGGVRVHERLR